MFSGTLVAVPVDPRTLPSDPATLKKIVVDLTAQMDTQQTRLQKVERLLEQLLEARNAKRSEQLSRDQLALFAVEAAAAGVTVEAVEEEPEDRDEGPVFGRRRHNEPVAGQKAAGVAPEARTDRARSQRQREAMR
jgi:hypothetical protein